MNSDLDEKYLTWLYRQIGASSVKNPRRSHWLFAKQLYEKEFVWLVPNDDNRIADAKALRLLFLEEYEIEEVDSEWLDVGCSMLEMLVALADRFAFMGGGDPRECFWTMIQNLDLPHLSDLSYRRDRDLVHEIDERLDDVIWRTYDYDGSGGLFPLIHPPRDQRQTELWYQMSAYVLEEGI